MKPFLLFPILFISFQLLFSQEESIGVFSESKDVGQPKLSGEASYDEQSQAYTLKGSGYNIWFERDEFHFLRRQLSGDFILTANFAFVGKETNPHRKIGWMIRESEAENAAHVSAVLHGDGLTVLQWRALRGHL